MSPTPSKRACRPSGATAAPLMPCAADQGDPPARRRPGPERADRVVDDDDLVGQAGAGRAPARASGRRAGSRRPRARGRRAGRSAGPPDRARPGRPRRTTSPTSWSMPRSRPTAWCEIGRAADGREHPAVVRDERDVGLGVAAVDREDRGRHAVSSAGMPRRRVVELVDGRERRRPRRRGAGRSRAARRTSGPARCGAGRPRRRRARVAPSTTLESSASDGAPRLPVVGGDVPADVAVAQCPRARPRSAASPRPGPERAAEPRPRVDAGVLLDRRLGVARCPSRGPRRRRAASGRGRTSGCRRGGRRPRSAARSPGTASAQRPWTKNVARHAEPPRARRAAARRCPAAPAGRDAPRRTSARRGTGLRASHYFSTPVMTMPRVKNRWKIRKRMIGMTIVMIVPAWM